MEQPRGRLASITVDLPEQVAEVVEGLIPTGLFGSDPAEVIERLVCQRVVQLVEAGFVRIDTSDAQDDPALPRELGSGGFAAAARRAKDAGLG